MRRGALLALALAACAAPGAAEADAARGERLTTAVCHALRLLYDQRAALEPVPDPPPAPTDAEHEAAWARVQACLRELGVPARVGPGSVEAARDALLAHDVVVLPPALPHPDPGLALARVTGREAGLAREVCGRTVRYRRVEHEGLLLPDYPTHLALRLGRPVHAPLARAAGPTVYVDRAEVGRRAGRGAAAHLDADALAREAELRQVAAMRFADDLLAGDARARVLHHASVLLACVIEGDERFALAELERLAQDDAASPDVVLGARAAREALAAAGARGAAAERARRALRSVRR